MISNTSIGITPLVFISTGRTVRSSISTKFTSIRQWKFSRNVSSRSSNGDIELQVTRNNSSQSSSSGISPDYSGTP